MKFINYFAGLTLYLLFFTGCQTVSTSTCDTASAMTSCQTLQCTGALRDCKNGAADGCETDTANDIDNCGACGNKCPSPVNGEASCVDGVCGVTACGARYKDCNASATDGCEVDTFRDVNNCGACGKVCQGAANATATCLQGTCQLACQAAYLNCNGDPSDGCEVNGASDLGNCGNCGNTCTAVGATNAACSAGTCISTMCSGTNQTCKAGPVDSCETDTATSATNCGACTKQCPAVANATPGCTASNCGIGTCNVNYGNCDSDAANGCETNLTTNASHCSACGMACTALPNAAASCAASKCGLGACKSGFANCDNDPVNGCEINTLNDTKNCGACNKVCPGGTTCNNGQCGSCAGNPQWTPVTCTTPRWVWTSDRAQATTLDAANTLHVLQTGCMHSGVPNDITGMCSLSGTGYVSTQTFIMAGCDSSWFHIGGDYTGACGGHDGDTYRHLALGPNDCYPY